MDASAGSATTTASAIPSARPWLGSYPAGVPHAIDGSAHRSLVELIEDAFREHRERVAYTFMRKSFTFEAVDRLSAALGAYLQSLGLVRGDRVAVMLPNVPQYPVAIAAILRAGFILVNVNPLYTPRELAHQLKDSGARAIVILENFAKTLEAITGEVPTRHVVVASMGDLLGPRGAVIDLVVRKVRRLVPPFSLPGAVRFRDALARGRRLVLRAARVGPDDVAVLQYTGGTTGVSKGAMLLHRNLAANIIQSEAWYGPALKKVPPSEQVTTVCALPIYHVFGFNVCVMLGMRVGARTILVPNPRDLPALLGALKGEVFHFFPAVNTLYHAIASHPRMGVIDWSHLVLCVGGGAPVLNATARLWRERTGCPICEGYGLSETSPSVTCNPVDSEAYSGAIGVPLPSTEVMLLDDVGRQVPPGEPGEIAVRGPQVMAGYWGRDDENARVMTADGFFRTGDIGAMDERGFFRVVDRKKDMILVSGFNVYPTEVEGVVAENPGVQECAVIGVPDERSGEAVKLVVVRCDPELTETDVRAWCEARLTGYKRPRIVEFRSALPKSAVGKVLRRELRASVP